MRHFYIWVWLLLGITACGKKQPTEQTVVSEVLVFDAKALPKLSTPNAKATELLEPWAEYKELVAALDALYTATNKEDVKIIIDNIIDKQSVLEKSVYPETFDIPQIKSRQKIVKTFVLKVKGALAYNQDLMAPSKELIDAFNSLVNQFSVQTTIYIDHSLILEDLE